MVLAILIVASVSLFITLVMGMALVRFRERSDQEIENLNVRIDRLNKELMLRLPPRPYGVAAEDREGTLASGPMDWRQ